MIYTLTLNPAFDRELTVPEIVFDEVLRAEMLRVDYGGKGFNVSRALAALGAESTAVGFIGGATGEAIATGLAALGIRIDFVPISGETRTNISIVSRKQLCYVKVNESGPIISPEEQAALLEKVARLAHQDDWWVLAGSLPPGAPAIMYAQLIEVIQSAGARVILDTSGVPLDWGCRAGPFLAKPNAVEAQELTGLGPSADMAALTGAIHRLGVRHALISRGRAGAILSDGNLIWSARPPDIEEKNPIGAGDSAVAGLVWGLAQNLAWPDALRWSMACGAATASLPGTAVGTRELVDRLAGQVKITNL